MPKARFEVPRIGDMGESSSDDDLPLECERERSRVGLYRPNQFIMWFSKEFPFLVAKGPDEKTLVTDPAVAPIFGHEYWHFLHNVSTFYGFLSFATSQHLLFEFNDTLLPQADGTSRGSTEGSIARWLELRDALEGEAHPDENRRPYAAVKVLGCDPLPSVRLKLPLGVAEIERVSLSLECIDKNGARPRTMRLGARAIEESVAHLVERQLEQLPKAKPGPTLGAIPYLVLPAILEHLVDRPVSALTACTIGTLALLTPSPGAEVCRMGESLGSWVKKSVTEEQWCRKAVQYQQRAFAKVLPMILDHDLPDLLELQRGRGPIEGALRHFAAIAKRALMLRRDDPLFDLHRVLPTPTVAGMKDLTALVPPCDVHQERKGAADDFTRDWIGELTKSEPDENGMTSSNCFRAMQAQQEYLESHIDRAKGCFRASASVRPEFATCPFYLTCDSEPRSKDPATCKTAPWRVAFASNGDACSYKAAVTSAYAVVKASRAKGSSNER